MDRYMKFDIVAFIRDSKTTWRKEERSAEAKLKRKLEEIAELPAATQSEIHSGNISDLTQKTALRIMEEKDECEETLQRLRKYRKIFDYCMNQLYPEEREILNVFYFKAGSIGKNVDEYTIARNIVPQTAYRIRREAEAHFLELLTHCLEDGE